MNKAERKQIRTQIGDLLDTHCEECEYFSSRMKQCHITCKIGKQIYKLGGKLDSERIKPVKITKEQYLDYKSQGLWDKDIEKLVKIGNNNLTKFKKRWGLIK